MVCGVAVTLVFTAGFIGVCVSRGRPANEQGGPERKAG